MSSAPFLDELEEVSEQLADKQQALLVKISEQQAEIEALKRELVGLSAKDADLKVRQLRRKVLGSEEKPAPAARQPPRGAEMRVQMRAPSNIVPPPPQKMSGSSSGPKPGLTRLGLQSALQRELQAIEGRIVELALEDAPGRGPLGEVCLLIDLRAGVLALARELPEHDLLLNFVIEHVERVQAVLKDLPQGGAPRARRFLDQGIEALGRLKALLGVAGQARPAIIEKLSLGLSQLRAALDAATERPRAELDKLSGDAEETLVSIYREMASRGFVATRSLLLSTLRA